MLLQDAIKSGKPFRRKAGMKSIGGDFWIIVEYGTFVDSSMGKPLYPFPEDILADDWELKSDEPEYEIYVRSLGFKLVNDELEHDYRRFIDERLVEKLLYNIEDMLYLRIFHDNPDPVIKKRHQEAREAVALYRKNVPEKK